MRTPPDGPRAESPVARVALAELDELEIAYSEVAGDGPALVLLHGLTGHRDDFLPQLPLLAARLPGFRILAPDLRGHGDSTHGHDPARYTFSCLVEDLVRFFDHAGVARGHLLGHSFGGMVALRFALAHPERLRSLALVSTAPFAPAAFSAETFERAGEIAQSRGMAALQAIIERRARTAEALDPADRHALRWDDAYWAHHRHRYRAMDPVAYRELGLAMVRQEDLSPRLSALELPTTVVVGVDDGAFLAGSDALARALPSAVRVDIPNAGHHPHRENTPAWLATLEAHLARAGS